MMTVFSAHAEVVPHIIAHNQRHPSILRARGGSSEQYLQMRGEWEYSPRTRR